MNLILKIIGVVIFTVVLLPYMLTNAYFENYQFVKDFKQGKIVVNQTEKIYIQENNALQDAIERVKNSIVVIQNPASGTMSGLVATADGNIITLASAIGVNGKVFLQGIQVDYKVVKTDKKNNLALLKIDKNNLQTVSFADIDRIKLGQRVFLAAATSPAMDNWLADEGIVTQIDEDSIKTNIIGKQMAVGGPLLGVAGELMGLNFIDSDGRISAIPISKIKEFLGL